MTLSNNHVLDGGYVGLEDTRTTLSGMGIGTAGAGDDLEGALRPYTTEIAGVRVAILGFASVFPKGYEARPTRPGLAPLRLTTAYLDPDDNFWEPGVRPVISTIPFPEDLERFHLAIAAAREVADAVIVSMHWGSSSVLEGLMAYEFELARDAVDHGADAVLCTHHHALRPIEWHRGRPIFYGLGALVHHFRDEVVTPQGRASAVKKHGPMALYRAPAEEFPLWPFAEESRQSMIVSLTLGRGENPVRAAGFFPAQMMADGSTTAMAPDDLRARAVGDYVAKMTADHELATGFDLTDRDGWAYVRLTDPDSPNADAPQWRTNSDKKRKDSSVLA
ncbi:hypothetical protein DC31_04320 [Microbacterium sp. CH12i]|nr:hypothetical protein DC31_04320 [Microbacterium sp. CH12i]